MFAFSNDPFKPLTEVERAFAAALLVRLQRGEDEPHLFVEAPPARKTRPCPKWKPYADEVLIGSETFVTQRRIVRLTERSRLTVSGYVRTEGWESTRHPDERRVLVFRLADVMQTVARIRASRRKYYRRATRSIGLKAS